MNNAYVPITTVLGAVWESKRIGLGLNLTTRLHLQKFVKRRRTPFAFSGLFYPLPQLSLSSPWSLEDWHR
jgi:hypothetical protein